MEPADLSARAHAAGLDRALTLFPEEVARAAALVETQRRLLGEYDPELEPFPQIPPPIRS